MTRNPTHPLSRALARPGHELQHRLGTREPTAEQLEVAEAALRACLELEAWVTTRKRLDPSIFDLPVEKMRAGYYTDAYFNHTRATLLADGRRPNVVMQVFQKNNAYLGGMDEAIAILKLCADDWDALTVHALYDGDRIEPYETVLTIEGDYTTFAHLETVVPRDARAPHADHDERRPRARGGERQADHLHAGPPRPPSRADGRRLCGVRRRAGRRRADRRHDRRAGVLVGRHAASAPSRTR